nr:MAG TPA: hypothetical protein [Caudoviricetes sp.]
MIYDAAVHKRTKRNGIAKQLIKCYNRARKEPRAKY